MKRTALVACLAIVGLVVLSLPAKADTLWDFSIPLTAGTTTGTVQGTLDLPCATGTCAATSLDLTSFPAGFGSFAAGNNVTNWANQVANSFTVTGGAITSDTFFAWEGSLTDYFCISQPATSLSSGPYGCYSGLNEVATNASSAFGYNFGGSSGITFTPATAPEPSSLLLLGSGILVLAGMTVGRKRLLA